MAKTEKNSIHQDKGYTYELGRHRSLFTYKVPDSTLAHGSSLGNGHGWATSKGTGAIQNLFSTDIGLAVTGSLVINFFSSYRDVLDYDRTGEDAHSTLVKLAGTGTGTFLLHPAFQRHSYELIGDVHVEATFFLPNTGFDDPTSAIQIMELENQSETEQTITMIGCLHLPGETPTNIESRYDHDLGAIISWNRSNPDWVRAFGCLPEPEAYLVTHDWEESWDPDHTLPCKADELGDTMASVQSTFRMEPGTKKTLTLIVAFTPDGRDVIRGIYKGLADSQKLLDQTIDRYEEILSRADVITPDTIINQGTQWCKANMLRVLSKYPTGIAFTNDPGKSSNVVARDSAWFIYGCDYILPEASCDLLKQMARHQKDSGMIMEYYNALDDHAEDYGLNINDNTPLFILAAAHHLDTTTHRNCTKDLYSAMVKAADYIISQEDDRGLVYCSADGTGAHGITGWRNIIPNRSINGAVTEVNSEAYAALIAMSRIAKQRSDPQKADYFGKKAEDLRSAINKYLRNPKNGLYYLNIDIHDNPITVVTADEVFPMIFGVADEDISRRIRLRLSNSDFMTPAGLRTTSSLNPLYTPDTLSGLEGGVWPGVTWWYAMAAVKADPAVMVESLKKSYELYVVHPPTHNTVPGQFSEWFDGASFVNRGMRLSPWEPPRFLWAMIEGAVGLDLSRNKARIVPRIPDGWKWLKVRNLRTPTGNIGFFAARQNGQLMSYTASRALSAEKIELYENDLSDLVDAVRIEMTASAFGRKGEIMVCIGNISDDKRPSPFRADRLLDAHKSYALKVFQSETGDWLDRGSYAGADLGRLSIEIEAHGFALFQFTED